METIGYVPSAYFGTEPLLSRWAPPAGFVVDATANKLPELKGFGLVKNLSAAMTRDAANDNTFLTFKQGKYHHMWA